MNLDNFELEDILLSAIKSEIESNKLYLDMAEKTKNGLLQDKLRFLAGEETKHKVYIEEIYMNHFPGKQIKLPKKTPVPLPEVTYTEETPMSILLAQAMNAEQSASEFYKSCSELFDEGSKIHNTLLYFSDMEMGHYKLLEMEKESMERFEDADVYWPMMHVGP
jgi:rubrerythrin